MKSYLICDNEDTLIGMRLAGVSGEIVNDRTELLSRIDSLIHDPGIGIILITAEIKKLAPDEIMAVKMKTKHTLIVEIPSVGTTYEQDFITRYIRESIGIKI